jgi:pimeloyl-ACP methyl ester carboxylesterase
MRYLCAVALLFVAACHGGTNGYYPDAAKPDATVEAGTDDDGSLDAFVHDYGSGMHPDGGYDDPATLFEGNVDIRLLSTYVLIQGTATSTLPPAIFLHMGPGLAHEYLPPLMRFLLPGRLLVYYDMRGQGLTSIGPTGSATLTLEQHARDLVDLIGYVKASYAPQATKVDLLGHGYGGAVAAMFSAHNPQSVAHLILTTPYPNEDSQVADFNSEAQSRLTTGERTLWFNLMDQPTCRGDIDMCTIQLWDLIGPHYMCMDQSSKFSTMIFRHGDYRTKDDIEFYLRKERYDMRPLLPTITATTTIIEGPCNPTPTRTSTTYAALIPGAQLLMLGDTGYFPMVEATDMYQAIVRHALSR